MTMSDDEPSLELKLARAAYAEAEKAKKAAEQDRAAAEYERGQAEHRYRLIADLERNIAAREQHLQQLGEAQLLERERGADDKLKQAQELLASYNNDKHAAAIYLRQEAERDKAKRSAA